MRDVFSYTSKDDKTYRLITVNIEESKIIIEKGLMFISDDNGEIFLNINEIDNLWHDNMFIRLRIALDGLVFKEDYYKEHYPYLYLKKFKEVKDELLFN